MALPGRKLPQGGMFVRERPPLAPTGLAEPRRSAWPAALLCGAVGVAALAEGHGPGRAVAAIALAGAAALPFVALALVEARLQRTALHLRAGQIAQLRWRETWQRLSSWEVLDAVALVLRRERVRVDWLPTPGEAEDAFFGIVGATSDGKRLVVRVLRDEALDAEELARATGRAVLAGADRLLLVALRGTDLPRSLDPPRAPGKLEIEVLRELDVLERVEEICPAGPETE